MTDWRTFFTGRAGETARLIKGLGWALLVPAMLGAKGCEIGQVGSNDASCGGRLGDTCTDSEFCKFDGDALCGRADATGTCAEKPDACPTIYAPVCGCDGKTYESECVASAAGVSVEKVGECEKQGDACGGLQGLACGKGEFCQFDLEASCGAADQTGVCSAVPEACDLVYAPVCGCDDKTYGNECAAHSVGVSVAKLGECEGGGEVVCGGLQGAACDEGQFCDFGSKGQCGAADQTGVCRAIPDVCTEEYAPVCGCDDETYSNECSAHGAGVSVATKGECGAGGTVCGGLEGLACAEGEFCSYPSDAQCGAGDQTGVCAKKTEACILIYAPVCGCDGMTYGNSCEASSHGVSVAYEGECKEPGAACGSKGLPECGEDEFCDYPVSAQCGAADEPGTCVTRPEACDADYAPVCGCDGKTYSNVCHAHAEGVSVAAEGECGAGGVTCGGIQGAQCMKGTFCAFEPEANCGRADATGTCSPMPELCTTQYAPVCGCDGQTYPNECSAHSMGVSVESNGACPETVCGGLIGASCGKDEYCDYPVETMCGNGDQQGVCKTIPNGCTKEYNPVCGCDLQIYDNPCLANAAGVSLMPELADCGDREPCGGAEKIGCGEGFFCDDGSCGQTEETVHGFCLPLPNGCTDHVDPVCGCDGVTYFNECEANAAGVAAQFEGECEEAP